MHVRIAAWVFYGSLLLVGSAWPAFAQDKSATSEQALAREIFQATGVRGGLVVQLGCGDGKLTVELRPSSSYQVHALDRDPARVAQAREYIRSLGPYGEIAVDQLTGARLPYIDNLVNLIVSEDPGDVAEAELLRVLAPQGVAYVRRNGQWQKTVKPRPADIDQWTHYLHDASGNAVAHDQVAGPPRHLQWLGSPRWSRHHDRMASISAMVSAEGRVFYISDEGSRVSIQMPPKWMVIARDAFNGTILWKQPIPVWQNHLWPLKSGPTQLARRLVAVGERVYVTLGLEAPLTELDAATGEIVRTFADSQATEEVIFADGQLFLLVNRGELEVSSFAPKLNLGDQARIAAEFKWNEKPREILAFDAASGQLQWKKEAVVSPLTLTADRERVFFHDGEKVVCVSRASGETVWNSPPASRRSAITLNFGPKLVLQDDVILFAGGDRTMRAYAVKTGQELWSAPHAQSGYQSPEDLLIIGGLVWNAPTTRTQDSGVFTGRDLHSGEVKAEFAPDVSTYWFHHRCYITKATDRFLMPSRTGVEFVDLKKEQWDINHWVRGGCLYGIMPCNGLVYAPPHDCACYPEAKIYGLNALAPASSSRELPADLDQSDRLQRGPAFADAGNLQPAAPAAQTGDWPTYRHDAGRSGFTKTPVPTELKPDWQTEIGGKLSSVVVADGKLFLAQIDAHTVHALAADTGVKLWSYTTGARVDSPPTYYQGRLLFGSTDGYVYCLRASDGQLAWRFRAAPRDERLMAFEQLESVWPVHGSVLVQDGRAYFVSGRSNFLDGGLRWFKLDVATGDVLAEVAIDEEDPGTGKNLQERLEILQMPVGLPDILSTDGRHVYMRSQKFDFDGKRLEVGPNSGNPADQASLQRGDGAHLFSPTGFLDDTWFHRSYWVYGRSFAGGHSGYYQAGKFAPAGRLLVADEENVYGFGRKPEYLRWTTVLEHQLFSTSREGAPQASDGTEKPAGAAGPKSAAAGSGSMIRFDKSPSLDPTGKSLAVEAWVNAERPNGVILAHGGPAKGYALILAGGKPQFLVRGPEAKLALASYSQNVVGRWVHLVGVLGEDKQVSLYVDGKLVASTAGPGLLDSDPVQGLEIGGDDGQAVGDYKSPNGFTGTIDQVRVYHGQPNAEEIQARFQSDTAKVNGAALVLACSFDKGDAADASGQANHGHVAGAKPSEAKVGNGMRFAGGGTAPAAAASGSFVKHQWDEDVPLYVRAMVKADDKLFIAGPPDLVNEVETFQRLADRDPRVQKELADQDAALEGNQGGLLWAVSAKDGRKLAEYHLSSLPVWDSMAAAQGRLYVSTEDGKVTCFAGR